MTCPCLSSAFWGAPHALVRGWRLADSRSEDRLPVPFRAYKWSPSVCPRIDRGLGALAGRTGKRRRAAALQIVRGPGISLHRYRNRNRARQNHDPDDRGYRPTKYTKHTKKGSSPRKRNVGESRLPPLRRRDASVAHGLQATSAKAQKHQAGTRATHKWGPERLPANLSGARCFGRPYSPSLTGADITPLRYYGGQAKRVPCSDGKRRTSSHGPHA